MAIQGINKMKNYFLKQYYYLYFSLYTFFKRKSERGRHELALAFLSVVVSIVIFETIFIIMLFFSIDLSAWFFFFVPLLFLLTVFQINRRIFFSISFRMKLVRNYMNAGVENFVVPKIAAILLFVFLYIYTVLIAMIVNRI